MIKFFNNCGDKIAEVSVLRTVIQNFPRQKCDNKSRFEHNLHPYFNLILHIAFDEGYCILLHLIHIHEIMEPIDWLVT